MKSIDDMSDSDTTARARSRSSTTPTPTATPTPTPTATLSPSTNFMHQKSTSTFLFDFHEQGLFLEIECPVSTQIDVIQCSSMPSEVSKSHQSSWVFQVDEIEPGGMRMFEIDDMSGDGEEGDLGRLMRQNHRELYLTRRDGRGVERWWRCCWRVG